MKKPKKIRLSNTLLIVLLGCSLMSYGQTSTTTTKVEEFRNENGDVMETVTTTTTTTEEKIENAFPITYSGASTAWHPLDCSQEVSKIPVERMQISLKERGYYRGELDGIIGTQTRSALIQFRVDNGYSKEYLVDECILGMMGIIIPPEEMGD